VNLTSLLRGAYARASEVPTHHRTPESLACIGSSAIGCSCTQRECAFLRRGTRKKEEEESRPETRPAVRDEGCERRRGRTALAGTVGHLACAFRTPWTPYMPSIPHSSPYPPPHHIPLRITPAPETRASGEPLPPPPLPFLAAAAPPFPVLSSEARPVRSPRCSSPSAPPPDRTGEDRGGQGQAARRGSGATAEAGQDTGATPSAGGRGERRPKWIQWSCSRGFPKRASAAVTGVGRMTEARYKARTTRVGIAGVRGTVVAGEDPPSSHRGIPGLPIVTRERDAQGPRKCAVAVPLR